MAQAGQAHKESAIGTILGWGALAIFAIGFAWYVGAPLIIGERWADKQNDAILLVKNSKPGGSRTMDDMIRDYSVKMHANDLYVGEFNWSAIQREGAEYEVTLLWREANERKAALWRVNLESKDIRPQGDEASSLVKRIQVESGPS